MKILTPHYLDQDNIIFMDTTGPECNTIKSVIV